MKKSLVLLVLLTAALFASNPRLVVLGGDARLLVNDYLEMWAYPGLIGDYEFVTAGSETPADIHDGWVGFVKNFGGTTWGVAVNHDNYNHQVLFSPGGWGAILSLDFEKFAPSDSTTEKDMKFGLNWGTDVSLFADYSDFAVGIGYDKTSVDMDTLNHGVSDLTFGASLRGHGNDFFNLFPIISAGFTMHTVDEYNDDSFTDTDIAFDLGAAHNRKIADKTNLVLGAFTGFHSTSYSGDYPSGGTPDSDTWITIPKLSCGVEQEVGKWFIFRAGAVNNTIYYTKGDFNSFNSSFDTHFGVGMHWDNFTMDATISEGFLHNGPYMVGGTANGFMGSLAATYNF